MKNNKFNYTAAIVEKVLEMFREDEEGGDIYKFDIHEIDLTELFTAMAFANTVIYNKFTQDDKNPLEYTYIANQLVVQDMLEKNMKVEE